jgi:hypothetical protein
MNFFACFRLPSQAILEYVGQEERLEDAEKVAESAALECWDRLIYDTTSFLLLPFSDFS